MSPTGQIVRNARLRPSSCGLDGSFGEYVAFFNGLDLGSGKQLFEGFSEWIASRSDQGGWNLVWPVLVLREAGFEPWSGVDWHALSGDDDARAVSTFFTLLDEFLDGRPDAFSG
jgi:hypothetical protein